MKCFYRSVIGVVVSMAVIALTVQAAEKPLVVGTKEAPPFAIKNADGTWSGISIELWRAIATELNYNYELRELDLQGLLDEVKDGKVDVGVAALTITREREQLFDFTHPFFITGLAIAVAPRSGSGWLGLVRGVASWEFLQVIGVLAVVLFALGVLVWWFERKPNPGQFGGSPASGLFSGFWWAAVTMTTVGYGDKAPVTVGGRIVAIIWMFVGLIAISAFIAAVTSALTVTQLESAIRGPQDLPRVRVGTVEDSTAQEYLRKQRIKHRNYSSPSESLQALAQGKIDAAVYDEPILRYLILTEFEEKLNVLGNTLERQNYGIALPAGSELREPINRVLLEKTGGSAWEEILVRYLGNRE